MFAFFLSVLQSHFSFPNLRKRSLGRPYYKVKSKYLFDSQLSQLIWQKYLFPKITYLADLVVDTSWRSSFFISWDLALIKLGYITFKPQPYFGQRWF